MGKREREGVGVWGESMSGDSDGSDRGHFDGGFWRGLRRFFFFISYFLKNRKLVNMTNRK